MENFKRHNFKKLKIWIMGMDIAQVVYEAMLQFPDSEKYNMISQVNRCSVSIPSNIAEGSSRTDKSFRYFLDISLGSSFELQTQLLLANSRGYLSQQVTDKLEHKIEEFQRATMTFQNRMER